MIIKKRYKVCIIACLAEFVFIYFLNKAELQFHSLFFHSIGTLLFFLPIVILLMLMSKDDDISIKKRQVFKMIYVFIILCYIGGLTAKLLSL